MTCEEECSSCSEENKQLKATFFQRGKGGGGVYRVKDVRIPGVK